MSGGLVHFIEPQTPAWLERMPMLPLRAGCPVVVVGGYYHGTRGRVVSYDADDHSVEVLWHGDRRTEQELASAVRVDLAHEDGQRYAVNLYIDGLSGQQWARQWGSAWVRAALRGRADEAQLAELVAALDPDLEAA